MFMLYQSMEQVFPTEEQPLNFDTSPIFLKNKIAKIYGCCYKVGVSNPTEQDTTYENETSGIYVSGQQWLFLTNILIFILVVTRQTNFQRFMRQ